MVLHAPILRFLQNSVKQTSLTKPGNRFSRTYLFTGPKGIGKKETAYLFFDWLLNNQKKKIERSSFNQYKHCLYFLKHHPDFLKITDKKEIKISQIQKIRHFLSRSTFKAQYKCVFIQDAEKMNRIAQNAFLKTLEEPNKNSIIILASSAQHHLLKTIISRLSNISFPLASLKEQKEFLFASRQTLNPKFKQQIQNYIFGRPAKALALFQESGIITKRRELVRFFLALQDQPFYKKFAFVKKFTQNKTSDSVKLLLESLLLYFRDCLLSAYHFEQKTIFFQHQAKNLQIKPILENINLILTSLKKAGLGLNQEMILEEILLKMNLS